MASEPVVLISDPAVVSIAAVDCGEPLRDLANEPTLRIDRRTATHHDSYTFVRAGVAARLVEAQTRLPEGVHLLIVEGYRPVAIQTAHFEDYVRTLRDLRPKLAAGDLHTLASRYIAPPETAPHPAGAAVDLTLCTADGVELGLGTPVNASPEDSADGCYFAAPQIVGPARRNREMLAAVLTGVGLVNYPTEWWHWSYGDRYWANATGAPYACYDTITSRTVGS